MIDRLKGAARTFVLTRPIFVELAHDDGVVRASHVGLGVFGTGSTAPEALADFAIFFEAQWDGLVNVDEHDLSDGARALRGEFLALVGHT